jgi:hypothetical protein
MRNQSVLLTPRVLLYVGLTGKAQATLIHKSKTPPEAFRHIRRGVDQTYYYYKEIIDLVHTKVKQKPVRMAGEAV